MNVKYLSELESDLRRLSHRYDQKGLKATPLLIAVGCDMTHLEEFLVYHGGTYYRFRTFLKALDICFKIFKVYGLAFPREAAGPWNIINHCLYGFDIGTDYYASKIARLSTFLKLENDQ